jgi:ubiquinone/menaquinone biosynthesis C-methylase UbiE
LVSANSNEAFGGSIPEFYDTYLGPLIFESYAVDIANDVAALSPRKVLEIAAGSGIVTRALAPLLGAHSSYTVTDLSQAMLDYARGRQGSDERIIWRQADALALPFPDAVFDVVVCQFSVMFFPDKVAGYSEAARVLNPEGKFIFSVWDDIESNEFADVVTDAAASVFPLDPPTFLARTPHGYHDAELIRSQLDAAGFSEIRIDRVEKISSAASARDVAFAYCHGTPLRNEIESRDADLLDQVTDRATVELESRFGEGPVSGKIKGLVVTASL